MRSITQLIEAQRILFSGAPSRVNVGSIGLDGQSHNFLKINVWRNHSIETILPFAKKYFDYGLIKTEFSISEYDDSLLFNAWTPGNIELIWLDPTPYLKTGTESDFLDWIFGRIVYLRSLSKSPIVLATWLPDGGLERSQALFADHPGVYVADVHEVAREHKLPLTAEFRREISGTSLNPKLHVTLARKLACHWIAGATLPPLKVIFVDLDNTLFLGVLGEDGPDNVVLTEGHARLQQSLLELKKRGVFLVLTSKNLIEDVESLFSNRSDFLLKLEDFSVLEVSWGEKSAGVSRALEKLGVGEESAAFVDDNLGELTGIQEAHPLIRVIHAAEDAELTARSIDNAPGLWRWQTQEEDLKRFDDQLARNRRSALLGESLDPNAYFESLGVELDFQVNPEGKITRLADLSMKTNQFNLSFARLTEGGILEYYGQNRAAIGVSLRDRLADSGMIGMVLIRVEARKIIVDELVVSCRALGRRLEDSIIMGALKLSLEKYTVEEIVFTPVEGPRNQPARGWLDKLLESGSSQPFSCPAETILSFEFPTGVVAKIEGKLWITGR